MPVLIAAVNRDLDIVISLAEKLLTGGGEVRCFLEFDDHELRSMGCKIAVGDPGDAYTMGAALTNVHTFIPILADPLSFADNPSQLIGFGKAAVEAATAGNLEQTILPISGASGAGNLIFETLRSIEEAFRESVEPLYVLKTPFVAGQFRPLWLADLEEAEYDGPAVTVDDLTSAIASADDREGIEETLNLDYRRMALKLQMTEQAATADLLPPLSVLATGSDNELESFRDA